MRRGNGWLGGGNGGGGGGSGEGCGTESSFNMHGGRTAEDNHAASFRTRHIDKCCKGAGGRRLTGSGSGGGGTERCGVAAAAEDAVSCCSNGTPAPNIQGSERNMISLRRALRRGRPRQPCKRPKPCPIRAYDAQQNPLSAGPEGTKKPRRIHINPRKMGKGFKEKHKKQADAP